MAFSLAYSTLYWQSADPAAGLTFLPFVVLDVHHGLPIEQVVGIDRQTSTNFFTANGHVHAAQL